MPTPPNEADIPDVPSKDLLMSSAAESGFNTENEKAEEELVGSEALENFRSKYWLSKKLTQKEKIREHKIQNPLVKYLHHVEQKGLLPKRMGLIKASKEKSHELVIESSFVRETYIDALSSGLNVSHCLQDIQLRSIGLNSKKAIVIIDGLKKERIKSIDLSYNPLLNKDFYEHFSQQYLGDFRTSLIKLQLEGNLMGDSNVALICNSLKAANSNINLLNLSKNDISDAGMESLLNFLTENDNLIALFLHWNRISQKHGIMLARLLQEPASQIIVLDLSFNKLGSGIRTIQNTNLELMREFRRLTQKQKLPKSDPQDTQVKLSMQEWKECFRKNKKLLHVDLSNNGLNKQDLEIFDEGLKENNRILGIHLLGNQGTLDGMGFIQTTQDAEYSTQTCLYTRFPQTLRAGCQINQGLIDLQISSNCWLCEGWSEVKFTFTYGISDQQLRHNPKVPIFLHLQADDYFPDIMHQDSNDSNHYFIYRYVPPGTQYYYFSVGEKHLIAQDQPTSASNQQLINQVQIPKAIFLILFKLLPTYKLPSKNCAASCQKFPRPQKN